MGETEVQLEPWTQVPCKPTQRPADSSHQQQPMQLSHLVSHALLHRTSIGHFNFDFNYAKITSIHQLLLVSCDHRAHAFPLTRLKQKQHFSGLRSQRESGGREDVESERRRREEAVEGRGSQQQPQICT